MTGEIRRFLLRLRNALWPVRAESELGREIAAHLDLLEDDYVRRGLPRDSARLAARRAFGGVEQAKEYQRDTRSFLWLEDARRDLRQARRLLARHPLFTLTAALSIGIGIGANTAVFTVANALLFHPPAGVVEPNRLVDIGATRNRVGFGPQSYPNYLDIRRRTTTLDGVYALTLFPRPMSLVASDRSDAERIFVTPVTVNYFTTLGVVPASGRLFDQRDSDEPGASPLAVISYQFWTTHFSADPAVVGRTLSINGGIFTVVGVAPKGFHGTGIRSGDAWVPLGMGNAVSPNRAGAWLLLGGRLKPGVPLSQASAELETVGATLQQEFPDENRGRGLRADALSSVPGNTNVVGAFLLLLGSIVVVVLAIACANIVGVLLARAEARRAEIAVRLAIGAGRRRLIRQLLTETCLLFALGGAIGLALARSATMLVVSQLPRLPFPIEVSLAMDYRAVMFTALLALMAALGSGLIPAWQSSRTGVVIALRDDARTPRRQRVRHLFVTAQIAFSILLIAVGGLFVRSLQLAGSSDPGFDSHGVELAALDLSQAGYTPASGSLLARSLLESVRRLPSVESASMALVLPGGFETRETGLQVPGVVPPDGQMLFGVDTNAIESGYFSTLRIPIISGRDFTGDDREGAEDVAIVGEGIARQFWPGQDAVGKHMLQPAMGPHGPTSPVRSLRVVGVVRDVKASSLIDGLAQSLVYVPLQQHYGSDITIVLRGRPGRRASEDVRAVVARINRNLPVTTQTLEEYSEIGLTPQRVALWLAGGLGLVGLLLAAIGIYGVTSYMVMSRTREFGVRLALGAQRLNLLRLVLRHGMAITVFGSLVGLALAGAAGRVLAAFLFGASPIDMPMFSAAAAMFVGVGLAACLVPAVRASFINPLEALRRE